MGLMSLKSFWPNALKLVFGSDLNSQVLGIFEDNSADLTLMGAGRVHMVS